MKILLLRTKFSCGCGAITSIKRLCYYGMTSPNIQILSDMTGLPYVKAKQYVSKYKIHNRDSDLLVQSIKFCQNLGYSNEEILNTRSLIIKHPVELEHHYLSMEEGGFHKIGPEVLARAISFMKTPIYELKCRGLVKENTSVPERLVSYIEEKEIRKYIPLDFSDGNTWSEIHYNIVRSFLKLKLKASEDEIIRLFRIHLMIKNKSLRVIQENIKIAEDLGFSHSKILKCGYLLNNYPNYTKTTLRDFSNLAGTDMRIQMRHYPKLIMTPPKNIIQIYGILKGFGISDEIISHQMNIFYMSPATVKLRLQEIKQVPDLNVLIHHPHFLKLVVHLNRTKSRLTFLQQLPMKCASLSILRTDYADSFEEYVREGRDVNKPVDVLNFLKTLFPPDIQAIKNQIQRHSHYLKVPLKDMKDTYDFLKNKNYKDSSISKVLCILLYPIEKIENAMDQIKSGPYKSLNQVGKLNVILYLIEKDHHFTGNGIWRNENCPDVSEKVLE